MRGNISALFERFDAKKLGSKVSSRECQFNSWNSELAFLSHPWRGLSSNVCDSSIAGWKARSRLPVGYNWTFFASFYGWGTNTSKSAHVEGGGSVTSGLNIRLKGYVYRQYLYTIGESLPQLAAGRFHTKKLCSRLFISKFSMQQYHSRIIKYTIQFMHTWILKDE